MTAELAISERLLADTDVSAIVGTRIYPNVAQQGAQLPYAVYMVIDTTREHHMRGGSGVAFTRVQLDLMAATYLKVKQLARAVRMALDGYRGGVTVGSEVVQIGQCHLALEQDAFDGPNDGGQKGTHRVIQDWRVGCYEQAPVFNQGV